VCLQGVWIGSGDRQFMVDGSENEKIYILKPTSEEQL
jgi:hypothetical protein